MPEKAEAGRQCVRRDAWPAVQVLWVATLVPKPENGVRTGCKPTYQNPTGLPVGAVRYGMDTDGSSKKRKDSKDRKPLTVKGAR